MFKENTERILRLNPQVFQNYVNGVGPVFHSIYELKEGMEGVKLRWAIP